VVKLGFYQKLPVKWLTIEDDMPIDHDNRRTSN